MWSARLDSNWCTRPLLLAAQVGILGKLKPRQEKVIVRLFEEGVDGWKAGLSEENYIRITRTSRATATRDLRGLVESSALIRRDERRHTRYRLNIPGNEQGCGRRRATRTVERADKNKLRFRYLR